MLIAQNEQAAVAAALGFGWFMVCFWVVFALVALALFVFWIIAIIDCAQRKNEEFPNATENSKTTWLVILLVSWVVGLSGVAGLVYYFMVMRKAPRGKGTIEVPPQQPQPPQPPQS
ncbi:MAG: DUF2516 family protein [Actinobacteria bacterium]|nr:DUF2516 family protein [Actinomycetota bacterium]